VSRYARWYLCKRSWADNSESTNVNLEVLSDRARHSRRTLAESILTSCGRQQGGSKSYFASTSSTSWAATWLYKKSSVIWESWH
jgi:hypothetical protein